jgi:hypothetical protein
VKPALRAGSARPGIPKRRDVSAPNRGSLTEQILTLCMSGSFGVREAIAEALRRQCTQEVAQIAEGNRTKSNHTRLAQSHTF